jgi:hypothetical protein
VGPAEFARGAKLDEFGKHGNCNLAVRCRPEIQSDRHSYGFEDIRGKPTVGQITTQSFASADRPDDSEVGGCGAQRMFEHFLVAVTLGGHDDDRIVPNCLGREVGTIDQFSIPIERPCELKECVRHGRSTDHDEAHNWDDGFDEDLQGTLTLTRDGYCGHTLGHFAELVRRPEGKKARLSIVECLMGFSDKHRLGACPAYPSNDVAVAGNNGPRAVMTRRRPFTPNDCGERELFAALLQLDRMLEHSPTIQREAVAHESVLTGGAPDTS